jgi:tight adherence protein B
VRPAALATLVGSGLSVRAALEELAPLEPLDELVELAIRIGAPLVPTLQVLERQQLHLERTRSELLQAQAIPRATRKLLLWLPVLTVGLSELMGLGTLNGLFKPLGLVSLALAIGLLWIGSKISGRMLAKADFTEAHPARELIALQVCISAGLGLSQIKAVMPKLYSDRSENLVRLSQRTGAALGALIESEIELSNQDSLTEQLTKAKQLAVALLIPLSLTTLPAFLLLTIPPMLIGITQ